MAKAAKGGTIIYKYGFVSNEGQTQSLCYRNQYLYPQTSSIDTYAEHLRWHSNIEI